MAIPPDSHYIPAFSIEDVLLDKDTGAPLTGGIVTFYKDNQRLVLKPVYQITGTSPNYTFVQLPNPMTLSAIGTFQDSLDNPTIPYFFPYDSNLDVELYYITVTSSGLVPQFTREAQPYINTGGSGNVVPGTITNEISNPQFAEVLFQTIDSNTYTFNFNAVTDNVVDIAPDWAIKVTSPAAGTVTVTQLTPLGSLNLPTNPGTLLQVSSTGLTSLQLRQRISGSPNLWGNGYISSGFMAKVYGGTSKTLTLNYSQSSGVIINQVLATALLPASGEYAYYPGTKFIDISTSTQDYPEAYIDIFFELPLSVMLDITSVMVKATGATSIADIGYEQESNPRQIDHLFHYYKPELAYKPLPSFLIGWDFPLNPAQFYGRAVTSKAVGANKAFYAWDQTLVFQTVNNSVAVSNSIAGGGSLSFALQPNTNMQAAIMQYLPAPTAVNILLQRICSMITCGANIPITATVTLWYSTNVSVPTLPAVFFTGLDANGVPTGVIGGWAKVPRGPGNILGDAKFTIPAVPANTNDGYGSFAFSGWSLDDYVIAATATYFAIVIGTATILFGFNTVGFQSVSLQSGDIPTIPAPQSIDEVLRECQYYYQKSFQQGTAPASSLGAGTGESREIQVRAAGSLGQGPIIRFPVPMINAPGASGITTYNVIAAGTEISSTSGSSWTATAVVLNGKNGFSTTGVAPGGSVAGQELSLLHWTADARLGTF